MTPRASRISLGPGSVPVRPPSMATDQTLEALNRALGGGSNGVLPSTAASAVLAAIQQATEPARMTELARLQLARALAQNPASSNALSSLSNQFFNQQVSRTQTDHIGPANVPPPADNGGMSATNAFQTLQQLGAAAESNLPSERSVQLPQNVPQQSFLETLASAIAGSGPPLDQPATSNLQDRSAHQPTSLAPSQGSTLISAIERSNSCGSCHVRRTSSECKQRCGTSFCL